MRDQEVQDVACMNDVILEKEERGEHPVDRADVYVAYCVALQCSLVWTLLGTQRVWDENAPVRTVCFAQTVQHSFAESGQAPRQS